MPFWQKKVFAVKLEQNQDEIDKILTKLSKQCADGINECANSIQVGNNTLE